jgi:hypothetical protein
VIRDRVINPKIVAMQCFSCFETLSDPVEFFCDPQNHCYPNLLRLAQEKYRKTKGDLLKPLLHALFRTCAIVIFFLATNGKILKTMLRNDFRISITDHVTRDA